MVLAVILLAVAGQTARMVFPLRYEEEILGQSRRHHVDAQLLAAIVYTESKFGRGSQSPAGAEGLMQLMPETAEWAAEQIGEPELANHVMEPAANLTLGAWYYAYLLDRYDNEQLALAAYNGGQRNVDIWLKRNKGRPADEIIQRIPFPETREFVLRVTRGRKIYHLLYPSLRN